MRGPSILCIDDQPAESERLRAALAQRYPQADFHAIEQVDAVEPWIERSVPSVVILDLIIPGSSGYEVLAAIRKRWPDLPVILFSRADQPGARFLARELGANIFEQKPTTATGYAAFATFVKTLVEGNVLPRHAKR